MSILHTRSEQRFTEHLRSVSAGANGTRYGVDITVGCFYLSRSAQVTDQPVRKLSPDTPWDVRRR